MKRLLTLMLIVASLPLVLASSAAAANAFCAGHPATISGSGTNDVIYGTPGVDVINAGRGADTIYGLGGDDIICGGRGKDTIHGGPGDDFIRGGNARDNIYGNAGDDVLHGDVGQDIVNGGPGFDNCTTYVAVRGCEGNERIGPPPVPEQRDNDDPDRTRVDTPEQIMLARINEVRATAGVAPLQAHADLDEVAENWSTRMATQGIFYHNPNYATEYPGTPWGWGENIAYAYTDNVLYPQTLLENSSGHYANMVNANFTHAGIGVYAHNGYLYVTQNFAKYVS